MRLLTWNVQWCRGLDGIVDPDVLCFQEVNIGFADLAGSQGENQVEALKREFPGYSAFFAAVAHHHHPSRVLLERPSRGADRASS